MGADFRQRTPGEYVKMLWRRKWLIILPTIAVSVAIAWVVWRLPNVYESKTQLLIKPPTIPNVEIQPLRPEDLALRLNNITQVIQSRSNLETLINKYDLYEKERNNGMAMDLIIDKMKKSIIVDIGEEGQTVDTKLPSFKISYRYNDSVKTRDVVANLASMYVNEQTKSIAEDAEKAKQFYEEQLDKKQNELETVQSKRLEYMKANSKRLPSTSAALIAQLDGLRRQQQALIDSLARLRDSKVRIQSQIADYGQLEKLDVADAAERNVSSVDAASYSQLLTKKATLEGDYDKLTQIFTPKNPEVIAKKIEIEAVNREILALEAKQKVKADEFKNTQAERSDIRTNSLKRDGDSIQSEIIRQESSLATTQQAIIDVDAKLNSVPETQVALESFDQERKSAELLYTQMLESKNKIEVAYKAQIDQKGALVQVVDPANLSTSPVAPKRLILIAMGLGLGLAVGLLFAAVFEMPRLLTIQNVEDASHYTKLPVLASVPEVLTPYEARWKPKRRLIGLAIGVIATIISIPLLAAVLTMTRVFDKFVS